MTQARKAEPAPQPQPKLRLTLIVEYETEDDFREAATELIEHARGLGHPVSAVLTGVPSTIVLL